MLFFLFPAAQKQQPASHLSLMKGKRRTAGWTPPPPPTGTAASKQKDANTTGTAGSGGESAFVLKQLHLKATLKSCFFPQSFIKESQDHLKQFLS